MTISQRGAEHISQANLRKTLMSPLRNCLFINRNAHVLEVLPCPLQCRDSRVEPGELLLDGVDNPPLFIQRSNRNRKGVELVSVDLGENRPALDLRCEVSELGRQ